MVCVNRLPSVTIVKIDCKRWLFIDGANFVILWMLTMMMIRIKKMIRKETNVTNFKWFSE